MQFRNIFIANPASLSVVNGQLAIRQDKTVTLPIEDISALMIESPQVSITAYALSLLAQQGVTVYFADQHHLPVAQLLPMNQFSRQKKLLMLQFEMSKPLKKQLWQHIVRKKIYNQAKCLELLHRDGSETMYEMAEQVRSGDTTNVEAAAAAYYFRHLFGDGFTRGQDSIVNAMLNYGFAILRGSIARNLVVHGLEPCLGIHHHSELNQFNLADDLIEPYRPLVELYVASVLPELSQDELTPKLKQQLFNLTNYLVLQDGKRYRVMVSVEKCVEQLSESIQKGEDRLHLPELLPLEQHRYA